MFHFADLSCFIGRWFEFGCNSKIFFFLRVHICRGADNFFKLPIILLTLKYNFCSKKASGEFKRVNFSAPASWERWEVPKSRFSAEYCLHLSLKVRPFSLSLIRSDWNSFCSQQQPDTQTGSQVGVWSKLSSGDKASRCLASYQPLSADRNVWL